MTQSELDDYQAERDLIDLIGSEQDDPRINDIYDTSKNWIGMGKPVVEHQPMEVSKPLFQEEREEGDSHQNDFDMEPAERVF